MPCAVHVTILVLGINSTWSQIFMELIALSASPPVSLGALGLHESYSVARVWGVLITALILPYLVIQRVLLFYECWLATY